MKHSDPTTRRWIPVKPPIGRSTMAVYPVDTRESGGHGELEVLHGSFESALNSPNPLPVTLVEEILNNDMVSAKGRLDLVSPTESDLEIIQDPKRMALLYQRTTEMLIRNLVIFAKDDLRPDIKGRAQHAKASFTAGLSTRSSTVADEIVAWCNDSRKKFPLKSVEYKGFIVDGVDLLDAQADGLDGIISNIRVQRQLSGTFIMAYSTARVSEKAHQGEASALDKRIYLNPDIEYTPEIFEEILHLANNQGISLQLKMFQRVTELASIHNRRKRGDSSGGIRGDGIVIYVNAKDADDVLDMVLSVAKDNKEAFIGREVSLIPCRAADGISISDQPRDSSTSLTSHRAAILDLALKMTQDSGLQGVAARAYFLQAVRQVAQLNGVNPNNLAFNL